MRIFQRAVFFFRFNFRKISPVIMCRKFYARRQQSSSHLRLNYYSFLLPNLTIFEFPIYKAKNQLNLQKKIFSILALKKKKNRWDDSKDELNHRFKFDIPINKKNLIIIYSSLFCWSFNEERTDDFAVKL